MGLLKIPKIRQISVRQDDENVVLVENGQVILSLPADAAKELSIAIKIQSSRASEIQKVTRLIDDQAFCIRAGIPLALTSNPEIFGEAKKESMWNRMLRRYIPKVKPVAKFGRARIIQSPAPQNGR